jgi:glutamine cyclotransferase
MSTPGSTRFLLRAVTAVAAFLALAAGAQAGVPQTVNYQGYLSDKASGAPLNNSASITFSLYSSSPARGNPVWREASKTVPVTNGIFSTLLGSSTPITAPFDVPYYLGVEVNGTGELPLQALSSVPYAQHAAVADAVSGGAVLSGQTLARLDTRYINGTYLTPQQIGERRWDLMGAVSSTPVGSGAVEIAFDGAGIWVANSNSDTLTKINPVTGAVLGTYPCGHLPSGIGFDGASLWVSNPVANGTIPSGVTKLDPVTGTILGTFPLPGGPYKFAFDGTNLWVTNHLSGNVTKLNPATGAILGSFPVAASPNAILFDGSNLWVIHTSGIVTKLDPATGTVLGSFQVGGVLSGLVYDGTSIWVSNENTFSLMRLDPATGAVLGSYPVGNTPFAIAYDGANIWVLLTFANTVVKFSPTTGAILGSLPVPAGTRTIAFDGASIWVGTLSTKTVTKLANVGVPAGMLTVTSAAIVAGAVGSNQLAPGGVTTAALADGAVTSAKLDFGAVGSGQIAPGSVDSSTLLDGAVTSSKIAPGAVGVGKLAANAVTSGIIAPLSVATAQLNDGAVDGSKILNDAVGGLQLAKPLAITGLDHGDLNFGEGDLSIGNPSYRLKFGVSLTGANAGDAAIMAAGGTSHLNLIAAGGTNIFSTADGSSGVRLSPGGGSWSSLSDRALKKDLEDVDAAAILAKVAGLPVYSWRYTTEISGARHLGPIAQDFFAAFGLGDSEKSITSVDADGIALAAIKALKAENDQLKADNEALKARLERLEKALFGQ